MMAVQPRFDLKRALDNLKRLSIHFIDTFRKIQQKFSLHDFLQPNSDARCHMLTYHLMHFSFMAMLSPKDIKVDIFDLLCLRGGAPLQVFCRPDGEIEPEKVKDIR